MNEVFYPEVAQFSFLQGKVIFWGRNYFLDYDLYTVYKIFVKAKMESSDKGSKGIYCLPNKG